MSFQILPNEICFKILSQLEKIDVFRCITLCKSWNKPASQIYYEELVLSGQRILNLWSTLFLEKEQHEQLIGVFHWVKKLVIKDTSIVDDNNNKITPKFETGEFLSLLSQFDNLRILDFSSSVGYNDYMLALRYMDNQYLKLIEDISKRTYYSLDVPYFITCYKHRQSLTHLSLSACNHIYFIDGLSGDSLYFLPMFEKLTDLSVYIKEDGVSLIRLLEICPNLTSVKFMNNIYASEESRREAIDLVASEEEGSSYHYSKQLKTLKLYIPFLQEPYMSYLEHYPLNYLDTLFIDMNDVDFYDWVASSSEERLETIGKSMRTIKNLTIRIQNCREYHQVVQRRRIPRGGESRMTRFYLLVGAIMGNRNLYCDAKFVQSGSSQTLIKVERDKLISLKYRIGRDDYALDGDDEEWRRNAIPIFDSPFPSPNMNIAKKGPEIINNLTIKMLHSSSKIPQSILLYVFSTCLYLTNIELSVYGNKLKAGPCEETIATNDSLTQHNLTSITLIGDWALSASLLDHIATYTPNISTLLCRGGCKYTSEKNQSRIKHEILDLTQLKNLKKFHVQLSIYDTKLIKFIYSPDNGNSTGKYYKIIVDVSNDGQEKHYRITPVSFDDIVNEHNANTEKFDKEYNKRNNEEDSPNSERGNNTEDILGNTNDDVDITDRGEDNAEDDDSEDNTDYDEDEDSTDDSDDSTDDEEENSTNNKRLAYITKIPTYQLHKRIEEFIIHDHEDDNIAVFHFGVINAPLSLATITTDAHRCEFFHDYY